MFDKLFRKKPLGMLLAEAQSADRLRRVLEPVQLTSLIYFLYGRRHSLLSKPYARA